MKRRLFFWLEALKISRKERIGVSVLVTVLLILMAANALIPQYQPYDDEYYAKLEEAFKTRSEALKKKEEAILARYQPEATVTETVQSSVDTVIHDTLGLEAMEPEANVGGTKINVNTADAKRLQTLPGIGPAYAARIIEYRENNGPFKTYEELLKIRGIGKKRLEKLLPFIQL